jgi:PAS domain S-box-containing protein
MNSELQDKVHELEVTTDDMNNLLTSTNIATIFMSPDFRLKRYTPSATELLNLIPSDIGRPLNDITRKFSDDALFSDAERVLKTLIPLSKEVVSNDGKWFIRWVHPYRTQENKIEGIVFTFNDITQLKNAQQLIEHFASIVESSQDAIIGETIDGIISSWNKGAEHVYGYTAEEIVGKPITVIIPEAGWKEIEDVVAKISLGETVGLIENVGLRKDGVRIQISLFVSPMRDTHGVIIGASIIARDVTMRRLLEEKLKEAANELEAFSYSVSHDLRAPLRHMEGFIKLLQQNLGDTSDAKTSQYMETISGTSKKMEMLIDDLLKFSHIGRKEMQERKVNLNTVVSEVVREIKEDLKERKIRWEIDELPVVLGDKSLLRQVFVNLLSNSVKFTSTRLQAEIKIGCKDEGDKFTCFVKDNGVGFNMKYVDKLFGVFQRLHSQNEFEGTGIGLANVQRIIARHGGRVWAEGALGEGATFYFSLPQKKEA